MDSFSMLEKQQNDRMDKKIEEQKKIFEQMEITKKELEEIKGDFASINKMCEKQQIINEKLKLDKHLKEIENKVNDSKEDIKYSTESIVIGIINKSVYKQNELLNKKNAFVIYGGDIEKFLISTMHTIEEFKIIA